MKPIEPVTTVALVADEPNENLATGEAGTVVEIHRGREAIEDGFSDDGLTHALATSRPDRLIPLHLRGRPDDATPDQGEPDQRTIRAVGQRNAVDRMDDEP